MEERRKHERTHIEWPVFLRSDHKRKQIGDVDDISLSGLKITFSEDIKPKETIGTFDLYLCRIDHPEDLLNISGKAVWSNGGMTSLIIGLEIDAMSDSEKSILNDFISHQDELSLEMDLLFNEVISKVSDF